jgi:adenylate cyclase
MSQTRRLAAILAADVGGYSRLMGTDEEGTLERLKALRRELVDPKIAGHHGRIVKTTGDGMLVEFASIVDSVRCAVAVQQAVPERNTGVGPDNRIGLRIGINLGDVIVEGDRLYGDGVNIAAPIEALADAGGVLVSDTAADLRRSRRSLRHSLASAGASSSPPLPASPTTVTAFLAAATRARNPRAGAGSACRAGCGRRHGPRHRDSAPGRERR